MIVGWSTLALGDLVVLHAYIAQHDPAAVERVVLEIIESVEAMLPAHPHIGRPGRISGTRELVIPRTDYIVPYRVQNRRIQILRLYHGARRWPDKL